MERNNATPQTLEKRSDQQEKSQKVFFAQEAVNA